MKTTFVHEDGDLAKIFNEGGDTAKKAFIWKGGSTAKKTFTCGSGDTTKAFVCESGDATKGVFVCGGGDVAAGSCLPTDDDTRVWGWWNNTETYVVDGRLRHRGRG